MKILIHNYLSETSTESLALTNTAIFCKYQPTFWDNNVSAFDIFDAVDPDLVITSDRTLTKDLLKRISQSSSKLAINCSNMSEDELKAFSEYIVNVCDTYIFKDTKFADVFLSDNNKIDFDIPVKKLVVVSNNNKVELNEPHHVISCVKDQTSDMFIPINRLPEIYGLYEEIYCTENNQTLFDAAYFGKVAIGNGVKIIKKDIIDNFNPFNLLAEIFEGLELDSSEIKEHKDVFFS